MLLSLVLILAGSSSVNASPVRPGQNNNITSACSGFFPGSSPSLGNTANCTIYSSGILRSYLLYLPQAYSSVNVNPLILSYHGGLQTAAQQQTLDELTAPYFQTTHMVVYPQGINDTWQGVPGVTTNDVQFTADLLDHLQTHYAVDPLRIFATGKSDGAGFDNVLACDPILSRRIAAFAPVSGAFYVPNGTATCEPNTVAIPCTPGRTRVPMLEFHGGRDTTIPYAGGPRKGQCLPSIPHWAQAWSVRDRLNATNSTTLDVGNGFELGVNETRIYRFGVGAELGLVTQVYDPVIGHDWPSMMPNEDNTVKGHFLASFNATPTILDFFSAHPLTFQHIRRRPDVKV